MRRNCLSGVPVLSIGLIAFSTAGILLETAFDGNLRVEAAFCRFHVCATSRLADQARGALADPSPVAGLLATQQYREALRRNPADAYRWCEAGQAMLLAGDRVNAGKAFQRAVELAPNTPAVLLQAAGFHLRSGTPAAALPLAAHILSLFRDYDELIFLLYDRSGLPIDEILNSGVPPDRAAAQSYFFHTLRNGDVEVCRRAWIWLGAHACLDDKAAARYVGYLIEQHRYADAAAAWSGYLGPRSGDYPRQNLVFNGNFQAPFTGCLLDWTPASIDHVEEARDESVSRAGTASFRVGFDGTTNLDYHGLSQLVVLSPGDYRFSAWLKSQDLTTDRGLAVRLFDPDQPSRLDASTPEISGTSDWRTASIRFTVSAQTHTVKIQLTRRGSMKFDNKISGIAWIARVVIQGASR
jgi:hypothetical protein